MRAAVAPLLTCVEATASPSVRHLDAAGPTGGDGVASVGGANKCLVHDDDAALQQVLPDPLERGERPSTSPHGIGLIRIHG